MNPYRICKFMFHLDYGIYTCIAQTTTDVYIHYEAHQYHTQFSQDCQQFMSDWMAGLVPCSEKWEFINRSPSYRELAYMREAEMKAIKAYYATHSLPF